MLAKRTASSRVPSSHVAKSLFGEEEPAGRQEGDWVRAHCDGGSRGNPGPSGFGAVVEDAEGVVLAELSEFLGIKTNNFAEYSGLLACLDWALENGRRRLRVVSDSELMVKQVQGRYQVKSPDLKPLFEQARRKIAGLEGFEISHALRHKNKEADRLANLAMDRGMKRSPAGAEATPAVLRAIPYPQRSEAPDEPDFAGTRAGLNSHSGNSNPAKADAMMRGFVRDGVVHLLGGGTLPEGIFVKIIRE